jgi:hypothetical protein
MALRQSLQAFVEVSGFSFFVFLPLHLTPETLNLSAWKLIFYNAP